MHVLIEADGLMESRALKGVHDLDLGSQARVSGRMLKGLMMHLPDHSRLTVASGKRLIFDAAEAPFIERRKITRAWLPRPGLLPFGNSFSVLPVRRALERFAYPHILKSRKADVIHYTQRFPSGDKPLAPKEIWTALDIFPMYNADAYGRGLIAKLSERLRGVEVMAISRTTADDVHRILKVPRERISLNYLAADRSIYHPEDLGDDIEVRASLKLPERFFFYCGALYNRKNVITLLKAVERFNAVSNNPPVPLLAAGGKGWPTLTETKEFEVISSRLEAAGQYRHLGLQPDAVMAVIHRACMAYVHPATFEGFGMTVLEAMSCGAPVICGRNSAISEVAGGAAEYVDDVLDANGLAVKLQRIAEAPEAERLMMRECSLAQAATFSWDRFQRTVALICQ